MSGAYDYMVKVWNAEREECLHTLQGHTNRVYSLQVMTLEGGVAVDFILLVLLLLLLLLLLFYW